MTDTIEAVARCLAPMLEGSREYDQMPANRRELKIWHRAGMCSINDATQDDAREAAEKAIAAHTKALIDGAVELERLAFARDRDGEGFLTPQADGDYVRYDQASATIAALQAQMCNRRNEGDCGCPLCVVLAEAGAELQRLTAQLSEARKIERAEIVVWLRTRLKGYTDPWSKAADAIEAGDHLV